MYVLLNIVYCCLLKCSADIHILQLLLLQLILILSKCCHNIDHLLRSFHYGYKLLQHVAGCHSSFSLTYLTSLLFVCVWLLLCAEYELLGIASHMGTSTMCGHYVCHIKKEGRWVIFNDSKVAVSEQPPRDLGYLYLFRRAA